jgi:hypothetical protein
VRIQMGKAWKEVEKAGAEDEEMARITQERML